MIKERKRWERQQTNKKKGVCHNLWARQRNQRTSMMMITTAAMTKERWKWCRLQKENTGVCRERWARLRSRSTPSQKLTESQESSSLWLILPSTLCIGNCDGDDDFDNMQSTAVNNGEFLNVQQKWFCDSFNFVFSRNHDIHAVRIPLAINHDCAINQVVIAQCDKNSFRTFPLHYHQSILCLIFH